MRLYSHDGRSGKALDRAIEVEQTLMPEESERIGLELRDYLAIMRSIPNPYQNGFCSASGGRVDATPFPRPDRLSPFEDTSAFHDWVQDQAKQWAQWPTVRPTLEPILEKWKGQETVFNHGDLASRNIMIHNGRLSGLLDWETAGWMPAYWDYFCATWELSDACKTIIKAAIPEQYDMERKGMWLAAAVTRGHDPARFKWVD